MMSLVFRRLSPTASSVALSLADDEGQSAPPEAANAAIHTELPEAGFDRRAFLSRTTTTAVIVALGSAGIAELLERSHASLTTALLVLPPGDGAAPRPSPTAATNSFAPLSPHPDGASGYHTLQVVV